MAIYQTGLFGIQADFGGDFLSLDAEFLPNPASSFFFRMQGDAMAPMIMSGDYLIIDRSETLAMNQIVVVDVLGERLCRYLMKVQGRPALKALNSNFSEGTIILQENEWELFGVVTMSFRNHRE